MRRSVLIVASMAVIGLLAGCADRPGVAERAPTTAVGPAATDDFCMVAPGLSFPDTGLLQPNDLADVTTQIDPQAFSTTVQSDFASWSQSGCPAGRLSVGTSLLCERLPDWLSHHALDGGGDGMSMSIHVITGGVEIDEAVQYFDPPGVAMLAVVYAMGRCGARPPSTVQGFRLYKLHSLDYPRWVGVKEHLVVTLTVTPDVPARVQTDMVAVALTRANDLLTDDTRTRLLVSIGNWRPR